MVDLLLHRWLLFVHQYRHMQTHYVRNFGPICCSPALTPTTNALIYLSHQLVANVLSISWASSSSHCMQVRDKWDDKFMKYQFDCSKKYISIFWTFLRFLWPTIVYPHFRYFMTASDHPKIRTPIAYVHCWRTVISKTVHLQVNIQLCKVF